MEIKTDIKLTANKSNQINVRESLYTINPKRKTIKIKSKNQSFAKEEPKCIKITKSNNLLQFPKIKDDAIYNIKQSHQHLKINTSFKKNNKTIEKSYSSKRHMLKNRDYIKLNSLFLYPHLPNKKSHPLKINYSNSIDATNIRRFLPNHNLKRLKLNSMEKNNNPKTHSSNKKNKKKKNDLYEIFNFMKMKYYEDTKAKMEKKLKDDSFIDKKDKEKLIKIGKFHVFWKNVVDYCGGYIFSQKIQDKKNLAIRKETKENNNRLKLKKSPNNRIYTSILRQKSIHYKTDL